MCFPCAKRRCERKEIITEIIETEIKYGRDLRIITDEFQRPMQVAGLLTNEQLSSIFLNVEELSERNARFTEALKDAIELALDEGDEDLTTVGIGKLFMAAAEPMLSSFKSYCTRQVSDKIKLFSKFSRANCETEPRPLFRAPPPRSWPAWRRTASSSGSSSRSPRWRTPSSAG